MKKVISLGLIGCVITLLAGCANVGSLPQIGNLPPIKLIPPAQLAADVCPILQADLPLLQIPGILPPDAEAQLLVIVPMVDVACANAGSIKVTDLQTFVKTGVPTLIKIINAASMPDSQKRLLTIDITLANSIVAPIVTSLEQGTATVTTSGVVVVPAVTPVAPAP